ADFQCPNSERCRRFLACDSGPSGGLPCNGGAEAECGTGMCAATSCTVCAAGARVGLSCRQPSDCPDDGDGANVACAPGPGSCRDDGDCPNSQCGPALFDFAGRFAADAGPVQVRDVDAKAGDPVPLTGLIQGDDSDRENVFVRDER